MALQRPAQPPPSPCLSNPTLTEDALVIGNEYREEGGAPELEGTWDAFKLEASFCVSTSWTSQQMFFIYRKRRPEEELDPPVEPGCPSTGDLEGSHAVVALRQLETTLRALFGGHSRKEGGRVSCVKGTGVTGPALAGGMPRLLGSMLGIREIPENLGARIHEATPHRHPSRPHLNRSGPAGNHSAAVTPVRRQPGCQHGRKRRPLSGRRAEAGDCQIRLCAHI